MNLIQLVPIPRFIRRTLTAGGLLLLAACSLLPQPPAGPPGPEILTIYPDGRMRLMGRPVPVEDVIIYPDGFGGEKAAIKVRMQPLHPDFYRDTIIVRRHPQDPPQAVQ